MSADTWKDVYPWVAGLIAAIVFLVSTAVLLRGSIATKGDLDKLRREVEDHDERDDERWDLQAAKSEWLAHVLGKIAGSMGIETDDPPKAAPSYRRSRPR